MFPVRALHVFVLDVACAWLGSGMFLFGNLPGWQMVWFNLEIKMSVCRWHAYLWNWHASVKEMTYFCSEMQFPRSDMTCICLGLTYFFEERRRACLCLQLCTQFCSRDWVYSLWLSLKNKQALIGWRVEDGTSVQTARTRRKAGGWWKSVRLDGLVSFNMRGTLFAGYT